MAGKKINSSFNYNATLKYENDGNEGKMDVICQHCRALKFKGEMPGMYCSNGKVDLPLLPVLPEPLQSLLSGASADSKHFFKFICTYNSCFQMTSMGCQERNLAGWMLAFRVEGQVYHRIGSLFQPTSDDAEFLQVSFLSSQEQVHRCCTISDNLRPKIVLALQDFLHDRNLYIKVFKTSVEPMGVPGMKLVIHADCVPQGKHTHHD